MAETRNVGPGAGGIGTATISMTVAAVPSDGGSVNFTMPTFINANSCIQREYKALSSGENVISVPDTASWCFILPSATNATAIYIRKSSSLDTSDGLQLGPTQGAVISFAAGTGRSFEIYTGGAINVTLAFF